MDQSSNFFLFQSNKKKKKIDIINSLKHFRIEAKAYIFGGWA